MTKNDSKNILTIMQELTGKILKKEELTHSEEYLTDPTKPYEILRISKAYLRVIQSPQEQGVLSIKLHPGLIVGRGKSCDLVLTDPNASRIHAKFTFSGDAWLVTDNHSKNGILHNGKKSTEALLNDGDKIVLGRTVLIYEDKL